MDTRFTYNFGDPSSDRNQAKKTINKMEPSVVVLDLIPAFKVRDQKQEEFCEYWARLVY